MSGRTIKTIESALEQAESRTGQKQKCRTQECDSREDDKKIREEIWKRMSRYRKDTLVWRTIEAGVLRSTSSKTTTTNQDLDWTRRKKEKVNR
jgi:hypothetical protein